MVMYGRLNLAVLKPAAFCSVVFKTVPEKQPNWTNG